MRSFLYLTISKRDSDEQSSEREVGDDEFKTLASSLVLNEGRGLRRERGPRKAWEFTISLGSPIQTAGIKTCRFALFYKTFSEFGCYVFENSCFGKFYEL